jgi:hypothetical protein
MGSNPIPGKFFWFEIILHRRMCKFSYLSSDKRFLLIEISVVIILYCLHCALFLADSFLWQYWRPIVRLIYLLFAVCSYHSLSFQQNCVQVLFLISNQLCKACSRSQANVSSKWLTKLIYSHWQITSNVELHFCDISCQSTSTFLFYLLSNSKTTNREAEYAVSLLMVIHISFFMFILFIQQIS